MGFKVEGIFNGSIDAKRFYMPGVKACDNCPKCSKENVIDFAVRYVSYPVVGKPSLITFYCEDCDTDWTRKISINVGVTSAE